MRVGVIWRSALITACVVQITLVVVGLVRFGIQGLNIDSLQQHPATFVLLLIVPGLGACLSLVLSVVPRIVQINLLLFLSCWVVVEVTFGGINFYRPAVHDEQEAAAGKMDIYGDDPILGYTLMPNALERHTEEYRGQRIFNVLYETDNEARRATPVDSVRPRSQFILFFGDSYTFGWGLRQRQTLPYYVGELAREYQPYNYGVSGWGPTQMLDILKTRDLGREVKQKEGYAVFFLIDDHVGRVIGANFISADWGSHLSHYVLDRSGLPRREGNFATGRPFTTLFYKLLGWSQVVQYFSLELPTHYSDADYRLTAEIIAQSKKILETKFKLDGFFVILSVYAGDANERLAPYLKQMGVKYLDLRTLYNAQDPLYRISRLDSHNSALANRVTAAAIVKELGIGEATRPESAEMREPSGR